MIPAIVRKDRLTYRNIFNLSHSAILVNQRIRNYADGIPDVPDPARVGYLADVPGVPEVLHHLLGILGIADHAFLLNFKP